LGKDFILISGIVVDGYHVASGASEVYPDGTWEKQKPFFKVRGLDLDRFYNGTMNVSIAPLRFEMVKPSYTFRQITWTDLHPPEDFSFSPCKIRYQGKWYKGYVYYPHPETKIRHFEDTSLIEVITKKIKGIGYGTQLDLSLDPTEIRILTE